MAGAGVKLFLSGEIAYAADINQYLMDQSVSLFLNEAARNSAFGNGIPITQAGGDGKPLLTAGRICFLLEAAGSTVGNPIRTIQYYDGSTWVDSGQFTVPDGAVTSAKLNAGVAGSGLSGGAGTALAVNVDDSTVEINADTLRVKDSGITSAKILDLTIVNGDISATAGIVDTKLATIATAGKVSNSATTATSANTANAIVARDASGDLYAGVIHAVTNQTAGRGVGIAADAGLTPSAILQFTNNAITAQLSSLVATTNLLTVTTPLSLAGILETAAVSNSALSSTTHLDALDGAVYYSTASTTSNITLNLRGNGSTTLASMVPFGKAFSCVLMITSGHVNGKLLTVTAGSSTVAVKWFGGNVSPAGSSGGSVDVYTITAVRTNSDNTAPGTFTIFISQSKFA